MESRKIKVQLSPRERAVLLKGKVTIGAVRDQLQACASSADVETIIFAAVDIHFLSGDLNHAIVKRGIRGDGIIELSERMDYIDDTGDGSLGGWC